MTTEVVDVPDQKRYEIRRDGEVLGHAAYQKTDELIVFTHTEVDPGVEGQGIGGQLVRGSLDHVRTLGVPVLPTCPFVQAWMTRHPEYVDLDYRNPATRVTD
jgi:uncharacterized protein